MPIRTNEMQLVQQTYKSTRDTEKNAHTPPNRKRNSHPSSTKWESSKQANKQNTQSGSVSESFPKTELHLAAGDFTIVCFVMCFYTPAPYSGSINSKELRIGIPFAVFSFIHSFHFGLLLPPSATSIDFIVQKLLQQFYGVSLFNGNTTEMPSHPCPVFAIAKTPPPERNPSTLCHLKCL